MITIIQTTADVEKFINCLIQEENRNFHPDEDFSNYVHADTGLPSYTQEEVELRNHLLDRCFHICEKYQADIYQIGIETLFNQLTPKR